MIYKHEKDVVYILSSKQSKNEKENQSYETINAVCKNDFILHHKDGLVVGISQPIDDYIWVNQTEKIQNNLANTESDDKYNIYLKYYELEVPFQITYHQAFLASTFSENTAFDKNGICKNDFLCRLSNIHADFILTQVARKNENFNFFCYVAITALEFDKNLYQKQDLQIAANALSKAEYKCEVNHQHKTFKNLKTKHYTHAYHLIPLNKWYNFTNSLDIIENIVSLCSHCYNVLLNSNDNDKINILMTLWDKREEALKKRGLELTIEEFFACHGIIMMITS